MNLAKSQLSSKFVSKAINCQTRHFAPKKKVQIFQKVTTDSRKLGKKSLFVAMEGEIFDGHSFIDQAIKNGATGVICKKIPKNLSQNLKQKAVFFTVKDTLKSFRLLATAWRKEFDIPVIAVAGSVGKTTTKELLASLLEGKWPGRVLKSAASENGYLGIPINIMKLRKNHKAAVIEVGIDEIGAMRQHLKLVNPTSGVLTRIGPEHLSKLKNIMTVAKEEIKILLDLNKRGAAIAVNLDDPHISKIIPLLKNRKTIFFTLNSNTIETPIKPILLTGSHNPQKNSLNIKLNEKTLNFSIPLKGSHNAENLLAAISIAIGNGLNSRELKKGLKSFTPIQWRSEIINIKGSKWICDHYNASPTSMTSALKMLADNKTKSSSKLWVCLGDMLELGKKEIIFHKELMFPIKTHGVNNILLYGKRMQHLHKELLSNPVFNKSIVKHFTHQKNMAHFLKKHLKHGDLVLLKGSRGMKMEIVLEEFKKASRQ